MEIMSHRLKKKVLDEELHFIFYNNHLDMCIFLTKSLDAIVVSVIGCVDRMKSKTRTQHCFYQSLMLYTINDCYRSLCWLWRSE